MPRIMPKSSPDQETVVYLYPGDIHVSADGIVLRTVLGSCVSVCIWEQRLGIGGMNHFLLAHTPKGVAPSGRYGDTATRMLIDRIMDLGASRRSLKAKVFGGAGVLGNAGRMGRLGRDNVESAMAVLEGDGIPVLSRDVGGPWGRRLILRLNDGTTSCVRLKSNRG